MDYFSADDMSLNSTLERALDDASAGLKKAACDLGAEAVAVLFAAGSQVDITYFWSRLADRTPKQQLSSAGPEYEALKTISGSVRAGNPLFQTLRELISPQSQSFLLFPWRMQQRVVTVAFCFRSPAPPHIQASEALTEKLGLIGLATLSVKEVADLRSQLKTVTSRLAGRKLVERAKGVLQIDQGITEAGAYEHLRKLSRRRRITLTAVAEEVVRERNLLDTPRRSSP